MKGSLYFPQCDFCAQTATILQHYVNAFYYEDILQDNFTSQDIMHYTN